MIEEGNQSIEKDFSQTLPQTFPSKVSKKSKFPIWLILGVVVVIFLGVGISLATRIWDPLWNPFRPEPEEVIEKMTSQMNQLKTLHSRTQFTFTGQEDKKEIFRLSLDFESDSDKSDPQNVKSAGDFYISLSFEEGSLALAGENKEIGKDFYLKLTSLPGLPPELSSMLQTIGINVEELKNQWIKVDFSSLQKQLTDIVKKNLPPQEQIQFEKILQKQTQYQKEIMKKLEELISGKKLYFVKKELPDKKMGNIKVYHYLVALDKKEFKNLILEISRVYIDAVFETIIEISPEEFKPSQEEIEREKQDALSKMEKDINQFFTKVGDIEGQLWIGKKDLYLYKVKGEKVIDLAKFEENTKGEITAKLNVDFSNFNQPVEIVVPKEYKSLEEIFKLPGKSQVSPLPLPIY